MYVGEKFTILSENIDPSQKYTILTENILS